MGLKRRTPVDSAAAAAPARTRQTAPARTRRTAPARTRETGSARKRTAAGDAPAGAPAVGGEVDAWFADKSHPQEALMREVRKVILAADPRVTECVKWSSPTFVFEGNLVSINPMAKQFVSLMFHTGGKIPGKLPQLTGAGSTCKYMRFDTPADLKKRKRELVDVVRAWCAWKSA